MNMIYSLSKDRLETKFQDVKPLYSESEASIEANRCLFCFDAPCIKACPTEIDIPGFIRKIASGNIRGSAETIFRSNILGSSTARVCPVEESCSGACVYNDLDNKPIQIGRLQRFATNKAMELEIQTGRPLFIPSNVVEKKVALIGAGPASLSCAAYLELEGVETVIYEKNDLPGGLNTTGIAPYKFMAEDALDEVKWLNNLGVKVQTGIEIGRDLTIEQLINDNDAVFIGIGLGQDSFPGIKGEELDNVWGATELIKKIKNESDYDLPKNIKKVIVIGGGNTAIDIARELAMLGVPEVDIVYRRTEDVMPGYTHELSQAKECGVRLLEQFIPKEISKNANGRLQFHTQNNISKEESIFDADWIVMAIGQSKFADQISTKLELNNKGCVVVNETSKETSIPNIFAGGDCINGGKEVVNAVSDGKVAAHAMLKNWGIIPVNSKNNSGGKGNG